MSDKVIVRATINGEPAEFLCEPRQSLLEVLRDELKLTGTKEGCNNGNCGACNVIFNGLLVNSCIVLAVEADGTVHLVYTVVVGQTSRVVHRQAPSDLSAWSGELQVSQAGELARRPSAAWDGQTLRVAYEVDTFGLGQTPRSIAVAFLDAVAFEGEIVAVSSFPGDLAPRVHFTGTRLWIDWTDADHEVAWTRVDPQGTWESLRYVPYETPTHQEFQVRPGLRQAATAP